MSLTEPSNCREIGAPNTRAVADRRTHKRINLDYLGRFMRGNKAEYPCRMRDISLGGTALSSPVDLDMGERVVALFDQLGALEGHVVRTFEGGFAIGFSMTAHKREKLASTLMFLVNKGELPNIEGRRHDRTVPVNNTQLLKLAEDVVIDCRVLDVSLSGASIETVARPPLGTDVRLGNLRGRVVRYHETGIALQFVDVQQPTALRRYFG